MLMFRVLGNWARGLYLIVFGSFWLFMSYYLSRSDMTGGSNASLTMTGIGALAVLSGVIVIARAVAMTSERARLPKDAGWRDDGKPLPSDTGFDADAAIARYLQNRPATAEPVADPEPATAAPPRPSFGRKRA